MTALVACETLLLVLLVVLVAGLLRSHAEILRRLGPPADEHPQSAGPLPAPELRAGPRAHEVVGNTLDGDALKVGFGESSPPTLLAFLSSGCAVCDSLWNGLRDGLPVEEVADSLRLIALTKDASHESPARLRELAGNTPVLMSSAAWTDYRVPASPYFVYVEAGLIRGEGSANGWRQIASLLRDATADQASAGGGERRTSEVDQVLAASGIGPGHPSLYPSVDHGEGGRR
jgi:hypothetical protein